MSQAPPGPGPGSVSGIVAVIPAGGAGTRLWPASRRARPKHVISLGGESPLLTRAYQRARLVASQVCVLTELAQVPVVQRALPGLRVDELMIEPAARGTTSALGLAAFILHERDPRTVMVAMASDHLITDLDAFVEAIRRSAEVAAAGEHLTAVGLRPAYPATGYGYLEAGSELAGWPGVYQVARFVEKPDPATAERFVESGRHYWNLAMFCWRVDLFLAELERYAPAHHQGLSAFVEARRRGDEAAAAEIYQGLPLDAVDYAVMERSDRLALIPAGFGWSDAGSWDEVHAIQSRDPAGNAVLSSGPPDPVLIDATGCLVVPGPRLVALVGVRDLVVVDTEDALLVCHREAAQKVKQVVDRLREAGDLGYL